MNEIWIETCRCRSELLSYVSREVGLGSFPVPFLPRSLISHTVFVDVKHREEKKNTGAKYIHAVTLRSQLH